MERMLQILVKANVADINVADISEEGEGADIEESTEKKISCL